MGWQTIETAPKGKTRKAPVGNKGGERIIYDPDYILVPTSSGEITLSCWLPDQQRWNMFSAKHPPTHWWDFGDGANMPEPPK